MHYLHKSVNLLFGVSDYKAGVSNWRQDCLIIRHGALFLKIEPVELSKALCVGSSRERLSLGSL